MRYYNTYEISGITIAIAADEQAIKAIEFAGHLPGTGITNETELIKKAAGQLREYFAGVRVRFELPLEPDGTAFQKKVWAALQTIPYGETRSYGQIAAQIGNPKGSRAVGRANNRNPIAIVIPCHRVIGADGTLVGYGGGLDIKQKLLQLESVVKQQGKKEIITR